MKNLLKKTIAIAILILVLSCEKEKIVVQEIDNEPKLIISIDSIKFNDQETKLVYLSTKPALETEFQIVSSPEWLDIYPKKGLIQKNIQEVSISSNLTGIQPGVIADKIIIMTTLGFDTITVVGYVGEVMSYNLPDTIDFSIFNENKKISILNNGNIDFNYEITFSDNLISNLIYNGNVIVNKSNEINVFINRDNLKTGTYFSKIYFNINNILDTVIVKIEHFKESKMILNTDVIDAEYSKLDNKLYYITSELTLNIFNTNTKLIESIPITYYPQCLSVSSDGKKAVIGHDGKITYVNLETKKVIDAYDVSCNAFDIVLADNWVYVFPDTDQWETIRCLDLSSSNPEEKNHTGNSIYAKTRAKLHPLGKYIYGADNGVSPSDIEKYDIQNGVANYLYDSPYHGDYPVSGNLWFSEDGKRIFTSGKSVFRSSEVKNTDLIYNGTINLKDSYSKIVSLDHSAANNSVFLIASDGYSWDSKPASPYVYIHNYENLLFKRSLDLEKFIVKDNFGGGTMYPVAPYFVFSNSDGKEIYVLTKAIGSGLINEWALEIIKDNF